MVAYTEYVRDPRVRRYAEALVDSGYSVDCFVLNEDGKSAIENKNGVYLYHLPISQYRGDSNIAYIFSYFKFFFITLIKLSLKNRTKYSIVHIHNMPDFLVFTAILNKLYGAKIILDVHDIMPELYKAKFNSVFSNIVYWVLLFQEKLSCTFSNLIITVHIPYLEHLIKFHGLKREKTHVIVNCADTNLFDKSRFNTEKNGRIKSFKIIYHGTIAKRFGLNIVLKGIHSLIENHPLIQFDIYGKGDGDEELIDQISKLNLSNNVKYYGQVPLDSLPEKISEADLGIVSYISSEATDLMLPLKLMEYIAMGLPVLTVMNTSINHYFNSDELEFYESEDPKSFSEKLNYLMSSSKRLNALRLKTDVINKRMNWEIEKNKYLNIINNNLIEVDLR